MINRKDDRTKLARLTVLLPGEDLLWSEEDRSKTHLGQPIDRGNEVELRGFTGESTHLEVFSDGHDTIITRKLTLLHRP